MASDSTNEDKDGKKKEKKERKWLTPLLFGMIACIVTFFIILVLAYFRVGSTLCCVPYCSGEMWYDCTIGALS